MNEANYNAHAHSLFPCTYIYILHDGITRLAASDITFLDRSVLAERVHETEWMGEFTFRLIGWPILVAI